MSVYAQAATTQPEETVTVTSSSTAGQENAWGPAATIAARTLRRGPKPIPRLKDPQSISVVTSEEMALHQPKSVKEALSYTPGVAVGRVAHPTPMTILSFVVLPQITRARITTSTV
jgi:iron complex outermembrane receptor protein